MSYVPPVDRLLEALDVAGLPDVLTLPAFAHVDRPLVESVLQEFARFAAEVIVPTDRIGDLRGSALDPETGRVIIPAEFAPVYRQYVAGGWGALAVAPEHGGGGFPRVVALALQEMFASSNLSLSLNPVLTQSAAEVIAGWGTDDQRARYLPKLVTGEWSGTMVLTEPDAGSDVGAIRTRGEEAPAGSWRVTGTKIFITWGEHDLAANIVHMVLARTDPGSRGTAGLSLFAVPRILPDGRANSVRCLGVEHKLGIRASPTCVMEYDGAVAELIGPRGGGIRAMFTMMNMARVAIGVQGLAVGEASLQQAQAFALQRRQGRAGSDRAGASSPIAAHPDVRRMLAEMQALTAAMRLVLYATGAAQDTAVHHVAAEARASAGAFVALLTPIAKAWCTDRGVELASTLMQVHGGIGFIEESGVPQRLRDVRISPIYEGTNGIQAQDLVLRKVAADKGAAMFALLGRVRDTAARLAETTGAGAGDPSRVLGDAASALDECTRWIVERSPAARDDVLAGSAAYLELSGTVVGGWLLARRALALARAGVARADPALGDLLAYSVTRLSRMPSLVLPVTAGAGYLGQFRL
jgi:alkylation response protein AidB-like acyl-CoA dehydrogenase